jgi:hypothetical protein
MWDCEIWTLFVLQHAVPSLAPVLPLLTALRVPPVFTGGGALLSATALCVAVPSLAPVLPLLTVLRVVLLLAVDAVLAVLGSGG